MTDQNIEEKLKQAVEAETPDILADLIKECGLSEGPPYRDVQETPVPEEKETGILTIWNRRSLYRALGGAAAAVFLIIAGYALYHAGVQTGIAKEKTMTAEADPVLPEAEIPAAAEKHTETETVPVQELPAVTAAVVSLDVNPSVEMNIDEKERVLTWKALNTEAEVILRGLDLSGADLRVASYAVIGSMLTKGYLNDQNNSVLVSVISQDRENGLQLEKTLSEDLNAYLKDYSVRTAVFGQYAAENEEVRAFAETESLSYGKAWLIQRLLAADSRRTEESLLKLSTQELLLLWENHPEEQALPDRISYGSVNLDRYISKEEAAEAAFSHIGIGENGVSGLDIEFGCEDGIIVYEVSFSVGPYHYEAEINAVTGEVVESDSEMQETGQDTESGRDPDTDDGDHDDDFYEADDNNDYESDDDDDYESEDDDDYDYDDGFEDEYHEPYSSGPDEDDRSDASEEDDDDYDEDYDDDDHDEPDDDHENDDD